MDATRDVMLFIDPPSHHFLEDRLFDAGRARHLGDDLHAPHIHLRDWFQARGVPVHTADRFVRGQMRAAKNVYISLGLQESYRALARRQDVVLSAFFAMECPIVEPRIYRELNRAQHHFKRIFSWSDSASLERFVGGPLRCEQFFWPQSRDSVVDDVWRGSDRKFLVMMNSNKLPRIGFQELYTERRKAVAHFARTGEIDLYGNGWDGPSKRVGHTFVPATIRSFQESLVGRWQRIRPDPLLEAARSAYRGRADSKIETLGRYTFALCFENMVLKGWITEKIFDCLFSGTVPVYWGAPEIASVVPPEAFIDMRRFRDYEDLRSHLKSLGPKEVRAHKESARDFLRSPAFRPFSMQAFTDRVRRLVEEDAGVRLPD